MRCDGVVRELHPLVIAAQARRQGIGHALVQERHGRGKPDAVFAKRIRTPRSTCLGAFWPYVPESVAGRFRSAERAAPT
jgi:hypothetical protein